MTTLNDFLLQHGIDAPCWFHPPVFTCEEADRLAADVPGLPTKNLFLCDGKGRQHLLLVVPSDCPVDLKALSSLLGLPGLRLASEERLQRYLQLQPGSVSVLALWRDEGRQVRCVLDHVVWAATAVQAHPLVNTATRVLSQTDLRRFLLATGHTPDVLTVPRRA